MAVSLDNQIPKLLPHIHHIHESMTVIPRHFGLVLYAVFKVTLLFPPVIAENASGLLFKNKRDRKILNVDPKATTPGDNSTRSVLDTPEYVQVVIYDHITRRKT